MITIITIIDFPLCKIGQVSPADILSLEKSAQKTLPHTGKRPKGVTKDEPKAQPKT